MAIEDSREGSEPFLHKDSAMLKEDVTGDQEMTLMDFVNVVTNQRNWFAAVALAIFIPGLIYVFLMPKIFVSTSSIMLEREGIYSAASNTGSQDVLSLRMHAIIKTILSTNSVKAILEEYELINENSSPQEINTEISNFRGAANFEFDNVSVLRENTGREGLYSMGMTVSYESTSPDFSYQMTNELTNRLLGNNAGKLTEESQLRLDFLQGKLDQVGLKLTAAEDELTEFKEENALSLPEMQPIAIRRIDDIRDRILQSDDRMKVLRDRADEIDAQLASVSLDSTVFSTDGQRIVSAQDQLELLLLEYASTKDKYSPNHPDRIEMEEKIAALRSHVGSGGEEGLELDLSLARQELAALKNRYSAQHPDVAAQEEKIAYMESQLRAGKGRTKKQVGATTNPIYNNLLARKRGVTGEISLERQSLVNLNEQLADIESRIQQMPAVERKMRNLVTVRDRIEKRYKALEEEIGQLDSTSDMQEAELFERFILLEAPDVPLVPSKPNKQVLIPLLFIFSLGLAYLAVFIRQFAQAKIFGSEDVEKVTDLPVYLIPEFS
ncbi:MAG: hypothetical protein AAF542_14700 [Pseudomonadota bacterium]